MATGINLINLEHKKSIQFIQLKKKINNISFFILILFIVFLTAVLGTFFYLSRSLKNSEAKAQLLRDQIKSFEKNESYAVIVTDRIKFINSIFEKRKSYLTFLNDLETLFVPGFRVDSLDFSATSLKLEGVCADNEVLNDLNMLVEEIKKKNEYSTISFLIINRSSDGSYNLALELKK